MNLISEDDQRGLNWSQVLLKYQRMKGNVTELWVSLNFNVARPPCASGRNCRLRPSGKDEGRAVREAAL